MQKIPLIVAALAAGVALAAGCGSSGSSGSSAMSSMMSNSDMAAMGGNVAVTSPAADLQVTLDQLLGEHALLAVSATQKGYDGSPDFAKVAGQLDQNSVALSKAIGSIYGTKAGDEFLNGKDMWRDHIKDFVDYTVALKKHDTAGQHKAVTALNAYITTFGSFLAKATGLPATAVQGDLREHVSQLKGQIDAYAQGRYTTSATLTDQAYMHMFMTGQILAQGIVSQSPDKFPMGQRVGEDARTAGRAGSAAGRARVPRGVGDAEGLRRQPRLRQGRRTARPEQRRPVQGDRQHLRHQGRRQFLNGKDMWRDHIKDFVDYTVALKKHDTAGQHKAVTALNAYITTFGSFLAKATGLPATAVQGDLREHVSQLKGQIDAYAQGRYTTSATLTDQAYMHMFMTGQILAQGIVSQSPDEYTG